MLVPGRVAQALEGKAEAFRRAAEEGAAVRDRYLEALDRLAQLTPAELERRLGEEKWPGAAPAEDLSRSGLVVPFGLRWDSAQAARTWALDRLRGVPTVAVDGSQIEASKEFNVPVSLVQVAWFENYHDPDRPYIKDVRNEILTSDTGTPEVEEYVLAESRLNQRRFAMEMEVAAERMRGLPPDPAPVVFVDGSLVLSFVGRLLPQVQSAYLFAVFGVLDASSETRVPLIGYVDRSFARDLANMLRVTFNLQPGNVFDAQLLVERMGVFDRTAAFLCRRGDVLPLYRTASRDYSADLCFVYLQTGLERLPARIDFPRWVLDAGLLDHVLDVVRAEIIVGTGYPYAIETADAAAVLTGDDRMAFYRLFHGYAERHGFPVSLPAKSASKAHRR
jgi:hypothetical protein